MPFDLLLTVRAAVPTVRESQMVAGVLTVLRRHGVRTPEHTVTWFHWRDTDTPVSNGRVITWQHPLTMHLRSGLSDSDLIAVVLHETQHLRDVGLAEVATVATLEARAVKFQRAWQSVVCGELVGTRPAPRALPTGAPSSSERTLKDSRAFPLHTHL